MTLPALPGHYRQALTLEDERDAQARRLSATGLEREDIARHTHDILTRFNLQGGRHPVKWLEAGGYSHGHAIDMRDAGWALAHHMPSGAGVSALAAQGRLMQTQGLSVVQVLMLTDEGNLRKAAAAAAGIGLGKLKYPEAASEELAGIYMHLAHMQKLAGLDPADLPEQTLTLLRLAASDLTPERLQALEGETPPSGSVAKPDAMPPTFLSHLRNRSPRTCEYPGCGAPGEEIHHLPLWPQLTKRGHHLDTVNVVDLCQRHHATGGQAAAHGTAGYQTWAERGWGSVERLTASRFLAYAEFAESALKEKL